MPSHCTRTRRLIHPGGALRVGGFDFDTAVQMHRAVAVLVVAERLDGQRLQGGLLFGEHERNLALGCAVNARVGPPFFPVIEIGPRLGKRLKKLSFQRRLLGVADAAFHLSLAVRIADAAGHGYRAVVGEHVAVLIFGS